MIKIKKYILRPTLIAIMLSACNFSAYGLTTISKSLNMLLNDYKPYVFRDGLSRNQRGDNYQHSLWVHYFAQKILNEKSLYALDIGLTSRDKAVFVLAALLHDVGKLGREELLDQNSDHKLKYDIIFNEDESIKEVGYFFDNEEHCKIGFEYLGGKYFKETEKNFKQRDYIMLNNEAFNFDALFEELVITKEERKLIACLVGIHFSFGNVKQGSLSTTDYLQKLQEFVDAVGYNDGVIDYKLFRLSTLIQIADVGGLSPCKACCTCVIANPEEIDPIRKIDKEIPFKLFGYAINTEGESPALTALTKLESSYKELVKEKKE